MSRVFSMLPEGIRNASTRRDRTTSQMTSATAIDLIHSQVDWPTVLDPFVLSLTLLLLAYFGSFHSARKMLVSPGIFPYRFDANTSFFPSGENMGKPSKSLLVVT